MGLITVSDLPPRSHLYRLTPIGIGTRLIESLTSYVNRLAWTYRVSPRTLVTQEIVPKLARSYSLSSRQWSPTIESDAMRINGAGEVAVDWSATLESLTMRADLRYLNVHSWANGLPTLTLLRTKPAWCPICYQDWQRDGSPIYQPLLWMLQAVTICLNHKKNLDSHCSRCHMHQTLIPSVAQSGGYCTECRAWLGKLSSTETDNEIDDDTFAWQEWVARIIEELRVAGTDSEMPLWGNVQFGLDACRKIIGGSKPLAHMINVTEESLSRWVNGKNMPSLENLLKLCYVLDISPLQLVMSDSSKLEEVMKTKMDYRPPRPRKPMPLPKNQENTLQLIQAVLDRREDPLSVPQIERRLGLSRNAIVRQYPEKAVLVSAQYRAYRKEQARRRLKRKCDEVRAATFSLNAQGIFPSQKRVSKMLSNQNWWRESEVRDAWRSALRELGLKS